MLKEKMFKLLFPSKVKYIAQLKESNNTFARQAMRKDPVTIRKPTTADLVRYSIETLGIPSINFSDVDDEAMPLHYLKNLTESERTEWISYMESTYMDERFQTIVAYVINLLGNYAIQKASDDQMKNGKIGIIGIRTFIGEFLQAHQEYADTRKPAEKFDPLAALPE